MRVASKQEVYDNLKYRIISHDLRPGEMLKERELMAHYGIGRTPLRELLIQLQLDGLIRRYPQSGTFVAPVDVNELNDAVEVRVPLEGLAGELAAQRIGREQLGQLRQNLRRAKACARGRKENLEQLVALESGFHQIIYRATCNARLQRALEELRGVSARFWYYVGIDAAEMAGQFSEHAEIAAALKDGDGKRAREALERHVRIFYNKIRVGLFQPNPRHRGP